MGEKSRLARHGMMIKNEKKEQQTLTIGDKIRESNERLAEFMEPLMHCEECTMDLVDDRPRCHGGMAAKCKQRMLDYLNQPSTDTP